MEYIYQRPKSIKERPTAFCPGCLHATAARIIAECIDDLGLENNAIGVMPIGCACLQMFNFNIQLIMAAHGRAPAVATGVKRSMRNNLVFTYQGDGDLASIGLAEIMHSANRGERFTCIFINNSIYGMTGGQMAPTTLIGQRGTTTPPEGRNSEQTGYPMKMCELLSQLEAPSYIARFALDTPGHIGQAKKGIKKAFQAQLDGARFNFIELLCNCPTNWGMVPVDSLKFMQEYTIPFFPLGELRAQGGEK
jgi:2-oxoglutarate ferredoxin oxidoreductase subunit beta